MEAIKYLMLSEYKNIPAKLKKQKKSAGLLIFLLAYLCFIPFLFNYADISFLKGRENFSYLLCIGALMETPYIMFSLLERKGIVFRPQDMHILFQAPISPKTLLVYGKNRNLPVHAATQFYMVVIGCFVFKVPFLACMAYVLTSLTIGVARDTSLAVLLYGEDAKYKKIVNLIKFLVGIIIVLIAVSILAVIRTNPLDASIIRAYFNSSFVYPIPIVGWEIALIQLCITGATAENVFYTIVNIVFVLLLCLAAKKMPCHGDYFEDAMQYTEAYEYAIQKRKMGGVYFVGQKNMHKKATVVYKKDKAGSYFYKALLEYKKMPAFIFSVITGVLIFAAIAVSLSHFRGDSVFTFPFCIVLLLAFICVVFQGFGIRWKKEITSPYFKLIPGKTSEKMFYIVIWEYMKALVDGGIFVTILSIGIGSRYIPYAIPTAVIYACIRCARMHFSIICNAALSSLLGKFGSTLIEYFSIIILVIPVSAILLFYGMTGREVFGFVIAAVFSVCCIAVLFSLSCRSVQKTTYQGN